MPVAGSIVRPAGEALKVPPAGSKTVGLIVPGVVEQMEPAGYLNCGFTADATVTVTGVRLLAHVPRVVWI